MKYNNPQQCTVNNPGGITPHVRSEETIVPEIAETVVPALETANTDLYNECYAPENGVNTFKGGQTYDQIP